MGIVPRDARLLLVRILNTKATPVMAYPERELSVEQAAAFLALLKRRADGEPLQYILGEQEFYGLLLRVTPDVLIPRPETEHLVEAVELWATQFRDDRTLEIADIGTGSGAIAIALSTHVAGVRVLGIDLSPAALEVAKQNAHTHGCRDRIDFLQNDLLTGFAAHTLDAVVSNPPYIPAGDATTMQREVVEHEPHTALFAGAEGLELYRRLIPQAHHALKHSGLLAMEFGFGQRDALAGLLQEGWHNVRFLDDYAGIPRVVLAERA